MKRILILAAPAALALVLLFTLVAQAIAAPFLTANPIPVDNAPNLRTEYRIDGGAWATAGCVWVLTATTRDFFCDLAGTDSSPTPARKYEAKYKWDAGIGADGAAYVAGETAPSLPFSMPWRTVAAPTTLVVVPSAAP